MASNFYCDGVDKAPQRSLFNALGITKEEMESIQAELSAAFENLTKNAVISEFLESRAALDAIVNQVNSILTHFITGEDPNGCTHNCSTCGGCH